MAKEQAKPKGGRKGGAMYPKVDLEKAVGYARKLVSKTHTGAQSEKIILPGVFDAASWIGRVRLSGAKQYGFVNGDSKAYLASELAKKINSATAEEQPGLLAEACLKPKIFKAAYDTFVNDAVTDAKIKQQFLNHDVHPDSVDECVAIFKKSITYAGLGKIVDNDKLQVLASPTQISEQGEGDNDDNHEDIETPGENGQNNNNIEANRANNFDETPPPPSNKPARSNVNVNIDVDPSMDPEKLEKLLKLLKNYGAL